MSRDMSKKTCSFVSKLFRKKSVVAFAIALVMTFNLFVFSACTPESDDASKWHTGTSYTSVDAKNGDFFYDTDDNKIYQKTDNGWGLIIDINQIEDNDQMEWLSGNGMPSSAIGAVGDFYIDTDSWTIYEKKINGWIDVTVIVQP